MPYAGWDEGGWDLASDPEERKVLLSVLESFRSYRRLAHYNGTHIRREAFYSLPSKHWGLLSQPPFSLLDSFTRLDELIDSNAALAEAIFVAGFKGFVAPMIDAEYVASIIPERHAHDEFNAYSIVMDRLNVQTSQTDMDKARSCVHQFYREWSAEGAVEREKCFAPVIKALSDEFQTFKELPEHELPNLVDVKVLVPGAGLGRLVFDICRQGYTVEGNEISYHELMASSLVLNHMKRAGQYNIAPFALNCSNHLTRADQFRTFAVPDVHPATGLADKTDESGKHAYERMSMAAGDFCVSYNGSESKDECNAVVTVFFIDTAPNIIRYIETVRNCLAPGGVWINLGPLLWHHASRLACSGEESGDKKMMDSEREDLGIGDPGSVELTDEEVIALVEHMGFEIEKHETGTIETGYVSNPNSMLMNVYRPSFWVARKK